MSGYTAHSWDFAISEDEWQAMEEAMNRSSFRILDSFSDEQLKAELKRRYDLSKPKPIKNPDFTDLIDRCQALVVDSIHEKEWYDIGYEEIIFTQAMVCIYGPDIVEYINKKASA